MMIFDNDLGVKICSECTISLPLVDNLVDFEFCPFCGTKLYENIIQDFTFSVKEILIATRTIEARSFNDAFQIFKKEYEEGEFEVREIDSVIFENEDGEEVIL